jgi:quercetin dioxygenase-like cupin family protein
MNNVTSIAIGIAAAGLFVLSGARNTTGQDVAVVNAKMVHVTLANSRVRVMEATLAPGEKEQMHSHPAYVIYVIAGGKARNHAADGTTVDVVYKPGDTFYREPLTHWAENIGDTPIRLVLVELKAP